MSVMASPQPQAKVFAIPELFENIFFRLPLRDLLLDQRVSRLWCAMITQNAPLQQNLFFQPLPENSSHSPELNPLLKSLFPPLFDQTECESYDGTHDISDIYMIDWFHDDKINEKVFKRPGASWRRMFPVNPPAKIGRIQVGGGCGCGVDYDEEASIREEFQYLQEEGARMGFLWDVVVHLMGRRPTPRVFVEWHMMPMFPPDYGVEMYEDENGDMVPWYDDRYLEQVERLSKRVTENKITLQIGHSWYCFAELDPGIRPTGLVAMECDENLIKYK